MHESCCCERKNRIVILERVEVDECFIALHDFYNKYPLMISIFCDDNYSYFMPDDLIKFDREYFEKHLIGRRDWMHERKYIYDIIESFYPLDKYIVKIGL